jgi:gas vesicle protein
LINLKYKLIAIFIIGGFLFGSIFALIQASNKISQLRAENKQLQIQLKQCQDTNKQLLDQIQVQQSEYLKAQKQLQELSNKPPKRVYVKKVIKEPVYISNQECQQLVDLINQAQEQLGQ